MKRGYVSDEEGSDYEQVRKRPRSQPKSLLLSMPREILELIIGKLPYAEVAKARQVRHNVPMTRHVMVFFTKN